MTTPHDRAKSIGCNCADCPLRERGAEPVFPPRPIRDAKLIVLGEGPGPTETKQRAYFAGASGEFLNRVFRRFKIPRERVYITNATLCQPLEDMQPGEWTTAIKCCRPRLERELAKISGRTILAYGGKAFQAVTKIQSSKLKNYMGVPWPGAPGFDRFQIIGCYHPAHVLRPTGSHFTPVVFIFTQRAWRYANNLYKKPRWPKIVIGATSAALAELKRIEQTATEIGFDVEDPDPFSGPTMCLGIADARAAVSVPWEEYYAKDGHKSEGIYSTTTGRKIARVVRRILKNPKIKKILQNGPHDILTAERLGMHVNGYHFDTMLAHAVVAPGIWHDLGFMAAMELRYPRWKTLFKATTKEKGLAAFVNRAVDDLQRYNAKDAWITRRLHRPLTRRLDRTHNGWAIFGGMMTSMRIALKMDRCGFRVDRKRVAELRKIFHRRMMRARTDVRKIAAAVGIERLDINSTPQMRDFFKRGLGAVTSQVSAKTGKPSYSARAMAELLQHPNPFVAQAAKGVLRYRKNRKLLDYLSDKLIYPDSCWHVAWNPSGARTGRWSCVSGDTLLYTTRGVFSFADYRPAPGDRVLTHTGKLCTVLAKIKKPIDTMYRVVLESGETIKCTAKHRFHTAGGWRRLADLDPGERITYVCEQEAIERLGLSPLGVGSVYERRNLANDGAGSKDFENSLSNCSCNCESQSDSRAAIPPEAKEIQSEQAGPEQSALRNSGSAAPQLEGRLLGLQRPFYAEGGGQALLFSSCCDGRPYGDPSKRITTRNECSPLRLRSGEQRYRKSSLVNRQGSQVFTPTSRRIASITKVGRETVYDLTIEGDHSYWASGCFGHNSSPNLQNISKPIVKKNPKTKEVKTIVPGLRSIFVPHTKDGWIVCADYDQLELRVIALLAGDDELIEVFNSGGDPHKINAGSLFNVDPSAVDKAMRNMAKVMTYEICYKGSPEGLWNHMIVKYPKTRLAAVKLAHANFLRARSAVARWHATEPKRVRAQGYIEAPLSGHRTIIYGDVEDTKIFNRPVQSTGADIINPAMPLIDAGLDWKTKFLVAQVHDELVLSTPRPISASYQLKAAMEKRITLNGRTLDFTVGIKLGPNWEDVVELEKGETIEAGVRRVGKHFGRRILG